MSWLYTILFSGMLFSSQPTAAPVAPAMPPAPPAAAAAPQAVVAKTAAGDETERFEQTYPLSANGRVSVANVNGSITVEAWDRNEVKLEYTKTAETKEQLAEVNIKIDARADYFSVETDYGNWKMRGDGSWKNRGRVTTVEYRLMVPRAAVLNEIETVNGSVAVSGFTNITKISAVNGQVNATNLRGTARVSTVNGELNVEFEKLDGNSRISLETVNGRGSLVIPSDANATLRAETVNGNITNDFGLPVRKGKYVGHDLYGRVGTGDVQIKLESVNGPLSITRRNDGKSPSPSVDLLPQKSKDDDEDWDNFDDEDSAKAAKANLKIAKASTKMSEKAVKQAMAETQSELDQLSPEIAAVTKESLERSAEALTVAGKALNSPELQKKLAEADKRRLEAMARMSDAMFTNAAPRVEKRSETYAVKGVPTVTVDAPECSVTVRGWDRSEVEYRVIKLSNPRNNIPLNVTDTHSDDNVAIKVTDPNTTSYGSGVTFGSAVVRIEVSVPKRSNLKITASGDIRISGVSGAVDLQGSEGSINVRDVDGKLNIASSDGTVRVIGFRGDLDAKTSDGTMNLEGDFTSLNARASDGAVNLILPDNASADLEATCEDVSADGINLKRVSGDENLTRYRIGSGGTVYRVRTDGAITVRGASSLRQTN